MDYINPIADQATRPIEVGSFEAGRRKKAVQDLEHYFMSMLMKEMRKSINEGGLFPKDPALDFYQEMLDDSFSRSMAESGQLGIGAMVEQQLRIQELQKGIFDEIDQVKAGSLLADTKLRREL